jgi:hypothetical protein
MSYTEFYMNASGNNMNAGSTSSDAGGSDSPSATSTNGSWNSSTNVFTAASGTPFSGVSAGEWASIATDGATNGAAHVAQVSSVGGGGASLTLSSTNKFGNGSSTSATGRTCRVGGAWADLKGMAQTMPAGTTAPLSMRVNVKFGTFAHTTTSITIGMSGTGSKRIVFRGYTSTPGDLDSQPTTNRTTSRESGSDIPSWTWTSGALTVFGDYITLKNLDIYSEASAATAICSGSYGEFDRVRFTNGGSNSASTACRCESVSGKWTACSFTANLSTSLYVVRVSISGTTELTGCIIGSGILGIDLQAGSTLICLGCVIDTVSSHGIQAGSAYLKVDRCRIAGTTGDGIRFTSIATNGASVTNTQFVGCGGYDINNTSASNNECRIYCSNNSSYSPTSGHSNGMGDSTEYRVVTEASDPRGDLSAAGIAAGLPGVFEQSGLLVEALDIGLQEVPSGGGTSGMLYAADMTGGFGG